jgi:hypothetical protein
MTISGPLYFCWTNVLTAFQFQFANSRPAAPGAAWTAASNSACCAGLREGGTSRLLEGYTCRPFLAKVLNPVAERMGVSLQGFSHLRSRPPSRQQPECVPSLALPWRRCTIHTFPHRLRIQLPALQQARNLVHRSRPPRPIVADSIPQPLCGFHLGFSLAVWRRCNQAVQTVSVKVGGQPSTQIKQGRRWASLFDSVHKNHRKLG